MQRVLKKCLVFACLLFHLPIFLCFPLLPRLPYFCFSPLLTPLFYLIFLPFHKSFDFVYPKFLFILISTSLLHFLSSFSAFCTLIPSSTVSSPTRHWPHPHVNNKSHPAPPHLWGNPLAGHLCLSDREQNRCFILLFSYSLCDCFYKTEPPKNLAWPCWSWRG